MWLLLLFEAGGERGLRGVFWGWGGGDLRCFMMRFFGLGGEGGSAGLWGGRVRGWAVVGWGGAVRAVGGCGAFAEGMLA